MAINVTPGKYKPYEEKQFPKLMVSKYTPLVVFFEEDCRGQVIVPDNHHKEGEISEQWVMASFIDYNEPITIQNA